MTTVAVVLVTHDSQAWIGETLASVAAQTRPADAIIVVDDHSVDGTTDIVREVTGGTATILAAETTATDRTSRIAQNFQQGLRACGADVAVLGDHDDVWHADRIAHQLGRLEGAPASIMVASDGRLVDEAGVPTGGALRDTFPVPAEFDEQPPGVRMQLALRRLIATGGASAIRCGGLAGLSIPSGWLHDRWWSLVATAREGMIVDGGQVIDYRVSAHQEVGLEQGNLTRTPFGRLTSALGSAGPSARKLRDIRESLAPLATDATRLELQGTRLLRNLL